MGGKYRPQAAHLQALEALRKLRTEKTQEVKELRLSLETLRSHKDVAAVSPVCVGGGGGGGGWPVCVGMHGCGCVNVHACMHASSGQQVRPTPLRLLKCPTRLASRLAAPGCTWLMPLMWFLTGALPGGLQKLRESISDGTARVQKLNVSVAPRTNKHHAPRPWPRPPAHCQRSKGSSKRCLPASAAGRSLCCASMLCICHHTLSTLWTCCASPDRRPKLHSWMGKWRATSGGGGSWNTS